MSAQSIPSLTPERYLEIERAAEFKSEYFEGRMFAMSGGTYVDALLITSLAGELYQALRNRPCRLTSSELRVRTAAQGLHTYPDVAVVCGEPLFADDQKDTLLNPVLIAEVLSKSTDTVLMELETPIHRFIWSRPTGVWSYRRPPRPRSSHRG